MAKLRSPNYPSVPLKEAVEATERLWKNEHGTLVPPEIVAKHLGFNSLSGPARSRIGTLKQYGLIEGRGKMAVADLAKRILVPKDQHERRAALREAALTPELFRTMNASHPDASDDALMSYLVREIGFSLKAASALISSYRSTQAYARLGSDEDDTVRPPEQEMGMEPIETRAAQRIETRQGERSPVRLYSWPLSGKVTAEVRIFGAEHLSKSLFESLKEYLTVAAKMVPERSEEDETDG